jgi:SpoIID/LytB domain protein
LRFDYAQRPFRERSLSVVEAQKNKNKMKKTNQEPTVSIGIVSYKTMNFILHDGYTFEGESVSGENEVSFDSGKIRWNGKLYNELLFTAKDDNSSFTLKDVIIGVNFHWERKEDQRFQGDLKFIVEGDLLTAINILSVENYLISVISSEMSSTASLELLKAHAVISRAWLLAQIEKNKIIEAENQDYCVFIETEDERIRWFDREDHTQFDVCADDHCQRYQGISRAFDNIERVREAVHSTSGEVLLYNDKICDARYHKCCGGMLEEFETCWEDVRHPYLVRVRDADKGVDEGYDLTDEVQAIKWIAERPTAYCDTTDAKILSQVLNNYDQETTDFYRWKVEYSQKELSDLIRERSGIDFGEIVDLIPVERGPSARLFKLKVVGTKRTMIIGKELEIRRILSKSHLYSSGFFVEKKDGKFILHGAGWGHGAGLCQIGAAVMGENGDKYDKILTHYYVDAEIKRLY